ncbi:MAG TPA: alpha/beta fold hydrolase [Pyrinomonadaceae bacterium]|nr:alpha/beta fold hydrolase [Pyrinomonadaceae bacterium]
MRTAQEEETRANDDSATAHDESAARVDTAASACATDARMSEIRRALLSKPFTPHPLFRSGHAQTLAAFAWPRRRALRELRDDEARLFEVEPDVRVLVHCRWQRERAAHPTLLLVHGLEGSSESIYMMSTALKAHRAGFNVLRFNIRTCGDTLHLTQTLYNSGMSADLRAVITELIERDRLTTLFLCGFSLGGNMSLKLAGEYGAQFPAELKGVCAVSPSVELAASADRIERRSNFIYQRKFIRSLKRRMRDAARLYPERYDASQLRRVRTLREFDELYTAPHGGFRDAADYYARSSSLPLIPQIRTPTLIIHAADDPFIPYASLEHPSVRANPCVVLVAPAHGGHVGFLGDGRLPGEDRFWAENRVIEFCERMCGTKN